MVENFRSILFAFRMAIDSLQMVLHIFCQWIHHGTCSEYEYHKAFHSNQRDGNEYMYQTNGNQISDNIFRIEWEPVKM